MLIVLVVDVVKHYWSSRKTEILRRKTRSAFTPRHRWSLWLLIDDDGTSTGMCTLSINQKALARQFAEQQYHLEVMVKEKKVRPCCLSGFFLAAYLQVYKPFANWFCNLQYPLLVQNPEQLIPFWPPFQRPIFNVSEKVFSCF